MKEEVSKGYFNGFKVEKLDVVISHLQYADDALFIGEACVENLWCMKAILRWFHLILGPKVNFSKISLIGVNVEDSYNSSIHFS